MARMKPGDPHQMWYQDFWNQFGCSTSKWSIGPLGETCHTKSQAFVLINKATMQLVWAGEQGQSLTLADYAMGKDADLTRRCTLFDQVLAPLDAALLACLRTHLSTHLHNTHSANSLWERYITLSITHKNSIPKKEYIVCFPFFAMLSAYFAPTLS